MMRGTSSAAPPPPDRSSELTSRELGEVNHAATQMFATLGYLGLTERTVRRRRTIYAALVELALALREP